MVQYDLCKNLTGHTQQGIATVVIRGVGRCLGLGGGGKHCSFRMLNDIHQMKLIITLMSLAFTACMRYHKVSRHYHLLSVCIILCRMQGQRYVIS